MSETLDAAVQQRLNDAMVAWMSTVRIVSGRPHLVPVWFVWNGTCIYICIQSHSVKARNIQNNAAIAIALEDGVHPVICEGAAYICAPPWPEQVVARFQEKYDWAITTDSEYDLLIEVMPVKWLTW